MQPRSGDHGSRPWRSVLWLAAILVLGFAFLQQAWAQPADEAGPPPLGDAAAGKNLFDGSTGFENGGPSCLACHNIAGLDGLGGGTLGPDLTDSYDKFGAQGLAGILAAPPFPTMRPIYEDRPLTAQEQADLVAFHEQASGREEPASQVGWLILLAVGGGALILLLMFLFWGRRPTEVRRPMLARARARIDSSELAKSGGSSTSETDGR